MTIIMIATFVPVGTEAGAPPGLMSRLRQAGEAAGPPGEKRRGFDWRVGGLADRRYKCNVNFNWRGTGLGAHGHEYFMRFMSRGATSRRGRRPSRDNYCAFDGGTIVAGSYESHNYRENDWRVGGLADRRYLRDPSRSVQPMRIAICDDRLGHKTRAGKTIGKHGP